MIATIFDKYREQILYLFFGVLTTAVNFIIFAALYNLLSINYMVSNVIAWIFSVLFAFMTNRQYVFSAGHADSRHIAKELLSFSLSRVFTLLVETMVLYLGASVLLINTNIIKITANIIVIVLNYILSKYLVFKGNSNGRSQL